MPKHDSEPSKAERLALAVASGKSVARACRELDISPRTGYGWTKKPEFKRRVNTLRTRLIDEAAGELARLAGAAARTLGRTMRESTRDETKIVAARTILTTLLSVREQLDLSERMDALEERIRAQGTVRNGRF